MAKDIKYIDVDRDTYEEFEWKREDLKDYLRNKTIINVETKKMYIRFWYNNEE